MKKNLLHEGSRAARLLVEIGGAIDDLHFGLARPNLVRRFGVEGARRFLDAQEIRMQKQALLRLQERKLIKVRAIGKELEIRLTKDGLSEYFQQSLIQCDILPDGKFCMVVFDIPESQRSLRQRLRRFLSRSAFIPMQRSVWISNIDAAETLSKFFHHELEKKWIRVFIATEY